MWTGLLARAQALLHSPHADDGRDSATDWIWARICFRVITSYGSGVRRAYDTR